MCPSGRDRRGLAWQSATVYIGRGGNGENSLSYPAPVVASDCNLSTVSDTDHDGDTDQEPEQESQGPEQESQAPKKRKNFFLSSRFVMISIAN